MRLVAAIREWLRALLFGAREDREAEEELRFHLEMEVEEYLRRGMSPAEARRAARLKLGGALQVREALRDARGLRWLDELAQDAPDRNVIGLFVRDGLRLTAIGVTAGAVLAAGLARLVASVVEGVQPLDPAAALGALATLVLAATLASYLPARRAARVDPMQALRVE